MSKELLKYFAPEQVPIKVLGPNAAGTHTRIEVLVTPFGSKSKKDLHKEFFDAKSYFGDDTITTKFALYEHFMNDWSNPVMAEIGKQKQILGKATLIKTDEVGRWFEFEVKRALEYHDALMNMIDLKLMGASTQCFPNSKVVDSDGYISMWVENEVSLTPTPANKETIGKVYEVIGAKSAEFHLPKLQYVKNGQILDLAVDTDVDAAPVATPSPTPEPDLVDQINDLLGTSEETPDPVVPTTVLSDEVQKAIAAVVKAEVKASVSFMMEMWGADVEEARGNIMHLLGGMDMMEGMSTGMDDMMKKVDESLSRMGKIETSLLAFAKFFKDSAQSGLKSQASDREKDILDTPNPKPIATPKFKSAVPEGLRASGVK